MKDVIITILAIIGGIVCIGLLGILVTVVYDKIETRYVEWERDYRYKHRFDKEPLAECYCIDCEHHGQGPYPESCGLEGVDRLMGDNQFCSNATPKRRRE